MLSASGDLSAPDLQSTADAQRDTFDSAGLDDAELTLAGTDLEPPLGSTPEEFGAALAARSTEVFAYLASRSAEYGEHYPFVVDAGRMRISRREGSFFRDLYAFLLVCASLKYVVDRRRREDLTRAFEVLSAAVAKALMPRSAEVHIFGAQSTRYRGSLFAKLSMLASDLGETLRLDEADFGAHDNGDGGLDIVAWSALGDNLNGKIVLFGQSACTKQWVTKQHSSSAQALDQVMVFMSDPVNLCFIPFDFRGVSGDWYMRRYIHKSTVIDRRRILRCLAPELTDALQAELESALDLASIRGAIGEDLDQL